MGYARQIYKQQQANARQIYKQQQANIGYSASSKCKWFPLHWPCPVSRCHRSLSSREDLVPLCLDVQGEIRRLIGRLSRLVTRAVSSSSLPSTTIVPGRPGANLGILLSRSAIETSAGWGDYDLFSRVVVYGMAQVRMITTSSI